MMLEEIIKTALLGTGKIAFQTSGDLADFASRITARQEDKEDAFLKYAGVSLLYQESGLEVADGENPIKECPKETKAELHSLINQHLRDAMLGKDEVLFDYLTARAMQSQKIASRALVPMLLNKAIGQKGKVERILSICGELGKWLCDLNPDWNKISEKDSETVDWETGSHEERKNYLKTLREQSATEARVLLQAGFEQENAVNRSEFIDILETGLSLEDEEFLMQSLADKSKKVKESALRLLQGLNGSHINNGLLNHLLKAISIKEERHLLVLKKKVLYINTTVAIPDEVLRYGIEIVSSQKGIEDTEFQLAQLFAFVEPAILARELNNERAEFINLLLEHPLADLFQPFLTQAAVLFKDSVLAEKLLDRDNGFNAGLLGLVSGDQKNTFLNKYLEQYFIVVLNILLDDDYKTLPQKLAERIIKRLAANPYQVTQPVYQRLALVLPSTLNPLLEAFVNDDSEDYQKRYFNNQAANMLRYIELRENLHF